MFTEADRAWPGSVPVMLALSHALARAGQLDQAQQKADAAVALSESGTPADRAAALEAAARIAIDRRDVAAAEKSAQARFDLDGSRALRQFVRGRELLGGGHYEEAHAALLEAARSDDEGGVALPGPAPRARRRAGAPRAAGRRRGAAQGRDSAVPARSESLREPGRAAPLARARRRRGAGARGARGGAARRPKAAARRRGPGPSSAIASAPTPSAPRRAPGSRAIRR